MSECPLCNHIDRNAINEAIVAGELRCGIATWYGVSEEVVDHHAREHLPAILEKEGLVHSQPMLKGMSTSQLQRRLYLINEILECEDEPKILKEEINSTVE